MSSGNFVISVPWGILFKKMKCCKCGSKMKKKPLPTISLDPKLNVDKGWNTRVLISPFGVYFRAAYYTSEIKRSTYFFKCEQCNYYISSEHQEAVSEYQKEHDKLILTQEERESLGVCFRA